MQNYDENGVVIVQPKNNNNLLLIVVGLLLIIGVGVGCYFLGKSTSDDNTTKEDKKEEEKTNNTTKEDKKEEKTNNTTSNDIIDTMSKVGYTFELNKCLNCSNISSDTTIKTTADNGSELVKVTIGENKNTVEINVQGRTIKKQFSKKIKQTLITSYGNDNGNLTIHYLMEDGTIEYTNVSEEINKENFSTLSDEVLFNTKEFNNIKNIVKLVPVLFDGDIPTVGVVAIQNDGGFYTLNV